MSARDMIVIDATHFKIGNLEIEFEVVSRAELAQILRLRGGRIDVPCINCDLI